MELKVFHRTEYRYSAPAKESVNEIKLCPRDSKNQKCASVIVSVLPASRPKPYLDLYGNRAHHVEVPQSHNRLVVETRIRIHTDRALDVEDYPYRIESEIAASLLSASSN